MQDRNYYIYEEKLKENGAIIEKHIVLDDITEDEAGDIVYYIDEVLSGRKKLQIEKRNILTRGYVDEADIID